MNYSWFGGLYGVRDSVEDPDDEIERSAAWSEATVGNHVSGYAYTDTWKFSHNNARGNFLKSLETGDNIYVFGGNNYLYTNSPTATYDFAKMKFGIYTPSFDAHHKFPSFLE